NGMGPTSPELLATILAYDDARSEPVTNAPHSGYQRVQAGSTILLMDAGVPPPLSASGDAHPGGLSFELSAKHQRIGVNCGLPLAGKEGWRQAPRATAAHSTVTFNDASSCLFLEGGFRRIFGSPIVAGPKNMPVACETREDATVLLRTSHDGYAGRFGIVHHPLLQIAAGGHQIDRQDPVMPPDDPALSNNALHR